MGREFVLCFSEALHFFPSLGVTDGVRPSSPAVRRFSGGRTSLSLNRSGTLVFSLGPRRF